MSPYDLKTIETLLISRKNQDWRDVEALAALNPRAHRRPARMFAQQ
jgi:hypothetical protein